MAMSNYGFANYRQSLLMLLIGNMFLISIAAKELRKSPEDLVAASSIAINSYKIQSTAPDTPGNKKYGYPYLNAPTLTPVINSRSDDDDDNSAFIPMAKVYGHKSEDETSPAKKSSDKKQKAAYAYGTNRRQGFIDETTLEEQRAKKYKEPKYRNFDELESRFRPRRIDYNMPYSEYYSAKLSKPQVSQRDPYISPSKENEESFYPLTKTRSYTTPYRQRGRGTAVYGNGRYEVSQPIYVRYGQAGNDYDGLSKYPSEDESYNYEEDYTIASNKPITGDIRKRLLDYAGASDMYEGEPDYLRKVALNKHKYGQIGNDYYAYGGPEYKKSYRDFPYVESKLSLIKKART